MRRFLLLLFALSLWSFNAQAQCDDPVAITMTNDFCSATGVGNAEKRLRVEAPPEANSVVMWTLTEAPAGSQFDGMEPMDFPMGETNSEFRITGGSKGNTVTMRDEPDNSGTPVYGTWEFEVKIVNNFLECESNVIGGYTLTALEAPAVPTVDRQDLTRCRRETATISVLDPGADIEIVWEVLEAPAGVSFMAGDQLEPNVNGFDYLTDLDANGRQLRTKGQARAGLYRFQAFARNSVNGCESDLTEEEFSITINELPADPVGATMMKSLCPDPSLPVNLENTGINVSNSLNADEKVVWILNSAPAGSAYMPGMEFTTDNCGDPFKDFGELAVANSSKVIRVNNPGTAPTGTYTFDAIIRNCDTGCESDPLSGFEITVIDDTEAPVAICPAPASGANILLNPSFEVNGGNDTPFGPDYFAFGPVFALDATITPTASAATGTFFLKMFGAVSGIFQDHPVTPGDNVTASVDVINASFDPMLPGCRGLVKVEFLDAGGIEISETEGNIVPHTIPLNSAAQSIVYAVAPPGAVTVRYVAVMLCDAGGAVFFDNASLQVSSGDVGGEFILANDPGACGAIFNYLLADPTDNCGATAMADVASGSLFDVGTTTVTVTATDLAGNSSSCSFDVTVNDIEAPVALCPEPPVGGGNLLDNGSFETNDGFDQPFINAGWVGFDVASAIRVSDGRTGTPAQDGTSYLKMFGGNTGIFQDVPVMPGQNLSASVYLLNAPFDPMLPGCTGFLKLEFINAAGGIFGVLESTRLDNTTPLNTWTEITLDAPVPAGAVAVRVVVIMQCSAGGAVFFDNATLTSDAPPSAGDFTITPLAGACESTVEFTIPMAMDNCPGVTTVASPMSGSNLPVGMNTITVTATDASGNMSTCSVMINVEDEEAPIPVCLDAVVTFNGEPMLPVRVDELYDAAASFDNCGTVNLLSPTMDQMVSCEDLGQVIEVTVEVEDAAGNPASCTATITVDGLPCGWIDNGGIGCTGNTSDFDATLEQFSLTAMDCAPAFPYTGDANAFVFKELCGDGEITALVTGVDGTGFGGVMMRDSEDPAAAKVAIGTNTINRVRKEVRALPGYPSWPQAVLAYNQFWVRINRTGDTFRAFASPDGVTWFPYIFQTIQMQECIKVGLYTYSEKPGNPITATFENVVVDEAGASFTGGSGSSASVVGNSSSQLTAAVSLFPNPARNIVNLNLDQVIGEEANISIFNMNGQLMHQVRFDSIENTTEEINIEQLPAGTYFVNVKTASTQQSLRLIKQ